MTRTDRILSLLATSGNEAAAALLCDEFALARTLLRKAAISGEQLEDAVRLRCASGLLLEHCLVKIGAVDFDTMVEVMADRRKTRCPKERRNVGDTGYGKNRGPLAG